MSAVEASEAVGHDSEISVVNNLQVYVNYVINVPAAFASYGVDAKGAISNNPADHVFNYSLECSVPSKESKEPEVVEEDTDTPPEVDPSAPKTSFTFVNGKYRPLDEDDTALLKHSQDWFAGKIDASTVVSAPEEAEEPVEDSAALEVSEDEEAASLQEKLTQEGVINWLWTGLSDKEKKIEEERLAAEATKGAKGGDKKKGGAANAAAEEEARKKKEEEERLAAEAAGPKLAEAPANMAILDITSEGLVSMEELLHANEPLVFSFRRLIRAGAPAEWSDVNADRYRGEVKLSLEPFMEPGVTEHEYTVTVDPAAFQVAPDPVATSAKKPPPKKAKKKMDLPPTLLMEDDPSLPHPYSESGMTISLALKFSKPLVYLPEHRPRPEFKPYDIIPKRIKPVKKPADGVKLYRTEIRTMVDSLIDEWKALGGSTEGNADDVKAKFLEALQTKGMAASYKEKLKFCVVKIVKEKFHKKTDASQEEMQIFYNELYIYLLDLMHTTINECFSRGSLSVEHFTVSENTSHSRWKRLADEAEEVKDNAMAAKYHQERLVHESEDPGEGSTPDVWYEYGEFCLRVRDTSRAEQAFKEAIAIDMSHLPSLIAYGLLLLSKKLYPESEVFLQAAVDVDVEAILPWACLALFMDITAQDELDQYRKKERLNQSDYSINQAKRLLQQQEPNIPSINQYLAEFLLDLHFEHLADHCLANEMLKRATGTCQEPPLESLLLSGRLAFQLQNYEKAEGFMKQVLAKDKENQKARLLLGDVYKAMDRFEEAEENYDRAIGPQGIGIHGKVYVRLGSIQMKLERYDDARDNYLRGAEVWPCGLTWLGVGIAYYRLEDYEHAEQALNESNILNNLNPTTWAYLCLLCLKAGRPEEADFAFNQALKQDLRDPFIISEIGSEQQKLGRVRLAEAAFKRSIAERDHSSTHFLLGNTLTQMRLFEEARAEFATVVAMTEDEEEKEKAMKELKVVEDVLAETRLNGTA